MPRKKTLTPVNGSIQMVENTWYRLDSPEVTECCSCGLVHHTEYMFEKGRMFWRAHIDEKATVAARKKLGIKIVKVKPRVKTKLP